MDTKTLQQELKRVQHGQLIGFYPSGNCDLFVGYYESFSDSSGSWTLSLTEVLGMSFNYHSFAQRWGNQEVKQDVRLLGDLYLQSLRGVYPKDIGTFLKNKEAVIATLEKEGLTSIMDCVLKMPEILETQQA